MKGEADTGDAGRAAASGSVAGAEGAAVECDGGCDFFDGFFDGVEEFAVEQRQQKQGLEPVAADGDAPFGAGIGCDGRQRDGFVAHGKSPSLGAGRIADDSHRPRARSAVTAQRPERSEGPRRG